MPESEKTSAKRWAWIGLAFLVYAAVDALAIRLPPDGHAHGSLAQFLGRFHPLIVHLPIGFILLVPVLELAGIWGRRPEFRAAAVFVLGLATFTALVAAGDGWLMAWSGGYSGPLIARHLRGGLFFAGLCVVTLFVRTHYFQLRRQQGSWNSWPGFVCFLYGPLLAATVVVMAWASHQGGQITHGDTYLTEYMPGRVRAWLGVKEKAQPAHAVKPNAGATLYAAKIDPIFQRSCISCHNPTKLKGGLRMDSYAELMKGGKGGEDIDPWHPETSELVRRITLPDDDDDHMPNNGKNPLSQAEIKLIEGWIAAGATDTQPAVPPPPLQ